MIPDKPVYIAEFCKDQTFIWSFLLSEKSIYLQLPRRKKLDAAVINLVDALNENAQ